METRPQTQVSILLMKCGSSNRRPWRRTSMSNSSCPAFWILDGRSTAVSSDHQKQLPVEISRNRLWLHRPIFRQKQPANLFGRRRLLPPSVTTPVMLVATTSRMALFILADLLGRHDMSNQTLLSWAQKSCRISIVALSNVTRMKRVAFGTHTG